MLIISNTETILCSALSDYKNALKRCMETINEIWCSKEDNLYPCLAILVNNKEKKQAAVINYFEQENGNMYVSAGDFQKEGIVKFGEYEEYQNKQLFFSDNRWKSCLLGVGEEKVVFAVCDQDCNIFALELIDEKHYLNGRLIEGTYFLSTSVSQIRGIKFNPESIIGLEFTGLVKARNFIRGYEWGRFQFNEKTLHHICDILLTFYLQTSLYSDYNKFKTYYKDVHERNVMFELTNKKHKGIPMRIKNQNNQFEQVHIRLRGIDLI